MTRPLHIDTIFAFVATDPEGNEGIIGATLPNGSHHPLVGADLERIESLRPLAERTAAQFGVPVQLIHFTNRVVIEEDVLTAHSTTHTQEESKA